MAAITVGKQVMWLVVLSAACGGNPAGDTVEGKEIFAKTCTVCHGPTGQPPAAMVARLGVKDLTSPEVRARITQDSVEKQVRIGSKNGLMPAFGAALNEVQIRSVAAFVTSKQFLELR